jgi:hypothetical protein
MTSTTYRKPKCLALRVGQFLSLATLSLGLAGCAGPLASWGLQGAVPHSGWLQLQGERVAEVSPGVYLELPQAPFRARFTDAQGVYYQSSLPLVYRTQHGAVVAVAGGLYVRHEQPQQAVSWTEPVWFKPAMAYRNVFAVRVFRGGSE